MSEGRPLQFRLRTLLGTTAIFALLIYFAMGPSVPPDRIRGVRLGMTETEVIDVMGRPHSKSIDGYNWFWHIRPSRNSSDFKDQSMVSFSNGRVSNALNY
jgi:hypothetical protein